MKKTLSTCPARTAVAYARYSSSGQRDVSIEQQLSDIRAFAQREGYTIIHEYADHARSGFKNTASRSEFQAMIAASLSGTFDTVLCWKVDRFGRSRADSATYKAKLSALGVSVVYVMEPIPEGAAGVLTEGMLEAIAEWYSRNLSENVTRGLRDNASKCLYNGTKLLGYGHGPDDRYEIIPEEAAKVKFIFTRYADGHTAQSICNELNRSGMRTSRGNPFTIDSLMRILRNERYSGVYIWGDVRVPGGMPAIISRELWEAAQRMRNKKARHIEKTGIDFLLTGKAYCGLCGRSMIGDSGTSSTGATHYYYTCQGHKSRSGCKKKNHRKTVLEDQVVNYLIDVCLSDAQIARMVEQITSDMKERERRSPLAAMRKELEEVRTKIQNINNAIASGVYGPSTVDMLRDLENKSAELTRSISLREFSESQFAEPERVSFFLHRFAHCDRSNMDDRRLLIRVFLNAVYVYDDHLKIIVNSVEGAAAVPLEELPEDPPNRSDLVDGPVRKPQFPLRFFVAQKQPAFRRLFSDPFLLLLSGSSYGAGFSASAAFDAGVSIDYVFSVAFRDGRNGALGSAGAAADAFVRNFVSHF